MAVPFFNLTRQINSQKEEVLSAVSQVIDSGAFILGPNVAAFEKEFAAYNGSKHVVGVASGTDALLLALRACGIKAGDEVITSPFTFIATSGTIVMTGATPVFADIIPGTFNLDPKSVAKKITAKTKAIIPVHLYGLSAEMDELMALAKKHNLKVIEDCAQATGATYRGEKVGSIGDCGTFSFFPTKNLGGFGDGGLVTTNDDKIYEELKVLRNHGSRSQYHYDILGYNSRLDELQAAILRKRLPLLSAWIHNRQENAKYYNENLKDIKEITLPEVPANAPHTYNQYTIRVKDRDKLVAHIRAQEVGAMVYYPLSLHLQKTYADLGYKPGDLPESEKAQSEVLSLPIFPELTPDELAQVVKAVRSYYV